MRSAQSCKLILATVEGASWLFIGAIAALNIALPTFPAFMSSLVMENPQPFRLVGRFVLTVLQINVLFGHVKLLMLFVYPGLLFIVAVPDLLQEGMYVLVTILLSKAKTVPHLGYLNLFQDPAKEVAYRKIGGQKLSRWPQEHFIHIQVLAVEHEPFERLLRSLAWNSARNYGSCCILPVWSRTCRGIFCSFLWIPGHRLDIPLFARSEHVCGVERCVQKSAHFVGNSHEQPLLGGHARAPGFVRN